MAVFTRRSFFSQIALLSAGAAGVWLLRDRVIWREPSLVLAEGASSSGWMPFGARRQSLVTLDATANGQPVTALFDTGAQYSVVDRAFAETLQLSSTFAAPLIAYGVSGEAQLGKGTSLDVQVGDMMLKGLRTAILDLGPIAGPKGLSVSLILGQDVMLQTIADIDFPRRRIRFAPNGGYELPSGAAAAPVRREGRALHAEVTVDGTRLEVVLDTGASPALSLTREMAQAAGLMNQAPVRKGRSIVLGGVREDYIVRAESVTFAGITLRQVDIGIYDNQPIPGFPQGLLGVGALEPYRVILDGDAGRAYLVSTSGRRAAAS